MKISHILLIIVPSMVSGLLSGPVSIETRVSAAQGSAQEEGVSQFEHGMEHYQRREYGFAFQWFKRAAEQGDVNAYLQIGLMYDFGQGVQQSFAQALRWYQRAAEKGDQRAMYLVGHMHDFGEGIPVDRGKAMFWYLKSAHLGYANAQYAVAKELLKLADQSLREQAITWLQKAARQCHPLAEIELQRFISAQEAEKYTQGC